jgi:hypothetical protein
MAKTKEAKSAFLYVQRLLEDQYVQDELREAVAGLHTAYTRAAHKRADAAGDKKLYAGVRRAATSVRNAAIALRRPEPPPKHRVRNLIVIAVAIGVTVMLARFAQKQRSGVSSDAGPRAADPDEALASNPARPESFTPPS